MLSTNNYRSRFLLFTKGFIKRWFAKQDFLEQDCVQHCFVGQDSEKTVFGKLVSVQQGYDNHDFNQSHFDKHNFIE